MASSATVDRFTEAFAHMYADPTIGLIASSELPGFCQAEPRSFSIEDIYIPPILESGSAAFGEAVPKGFIPEEHMRAFLKHRAEASDPEAHMRAFLKHRAEASDPDVHMRAFLKHRAEASDPDVHMRAFLKHRAEASDPEAHMTAFLKRRLEALQHQKKLVSLQPHAYQDLMQDMMNLVIREDLRRADHTQSRKRSYEPEPEDADVSLLDIETTLLNLRDISPQAYALSEQELSRGLLPPGERLVLVLASAGGGKSMLLRMCTYAYTAPQKLASLEITRFLSNLGLPPAGDIDYPFLVKCRKLKSGNLLGAILEQLFPDTQTRPNVSDFAGFPFERALLLLDGLDELPQNLRYDLLMHLNEMRQDPRFSMLRVLIASRSSGALTIQELSRLQLTRVRSFHIRALDREQILGTQGDGFASRWLACVYPENQTTYLRLITEMFDQPRYDYLHAMLTTPLLMVDILCIIASGQVLPEERGKVFASLLSTLLKWKLPVNKTDSIAHDRMAALAYLAYFMSSNQTLNVSARSYFRLRRQHMQRFGSWDDSFYGLTEQQCKQLLEDELQYLSVSLGILSYNPDGKNGGTIQFNHRQYQEYFTAFAIVHGVTSSDETDLVKLLTPHLQNVEWDETVLFALFILQTRWDYNDAFQRLLDAVQASWKDERLVSLLSSHIPMSIDDYYCLLCNFFPLTPARSRCLASVVRSESESFVHRLIRRWNDADTIDIPDWLSVCLDGISSNPINSPDGFRHLALYSLLHAEEEHQQLQPRLLTTQEAACLKSCIGQGQLSAITANRLRWCGCFSPESLDSIFDRGYIAQCMQSNDVDAVCAALSGVPLTVQSIAAGHEAATDALRTKLMEAYRTSEARGYLADVAVASVLTGAIPLKDLEASFRELKAMRDADVFYAPSQYRCLERDISGLLAAASDQVALTQSGKLYLSHNAYEQRRAFEALILSELITPQTTSVARQSNLAYILRHTPSLSWIAGAFGITVDTLLMQGCKESYCFSVVNHALYHLDANPSSWEAADRAFASLTKENWHEVLDWWQTIAMTRHEKEGWLVCCWAARFRRYPNSNQVDALRLLVRSLYSNAAPAWLYTSNTNSRN